MCMSIYECVSKSFRIIPDLRSDGLGALAFFSPLQPASVTLLVLSVDLFASLERFTFKFGPSDLDFARPDCPQDVLDVVLEGRSGLIFTNSRERTDFIASIDFLCDFSYLVGVFRTICPKPSKNQMKVESEMPFCFGTEELQIAYGKQCLFDVLLYQ